MTDTVNLPSGAEPDPDATKDQEKAAFDHLETPHARKARPLDPKTSPDQLAAWKASAEGRQEALIDESLDESFPASDPPSAKHIT